MKETILGLNPPFQTGLEVDAVFDPPASCLENPGRVRAKSVLLLITGAKSVLLLTPWKTLESLLKAVT